MAKTNPCCLACQAIIDFSQYSDIYTGHRAGLAPEGAENLGYCYDCYCEKYCGKLPMVTDPSIPAPGTALTPRQKMGQRHTDGG